jgi:polysaccharide export outer membrane protein
MSGAKDIEFPAELTEKSNDPSVAEIVEQERAILSSRESAQERQLATLTELRDLLTAEIKILDEKAKTEDVGIELAEDELARVGILVEKGIATVSRKSDLELVLAGLKTDRLDRMTAIMRARQSLTEATRNAITVRDQRTTTVAAELQEAQANLAHLKVREEVLQRLVVAGDSTETNEEPDLVFTIVRQVDFESREIAASESTALSPGDVIKVSIRNPFEQPIKQRVNP